jgi:hypothetical protein
MDNGVSQPRRRHPISFNGSQPPGLGAPAADDQVTKQEARA